MHDENTSQHGSDIEDSHQVITSEHKRPRLRLTKLKPKVVALLVVAIAVLGIAGYGYSGLNAKNAKLQKNNNDLRATNTNLAKSLGNYTQYPDETSLEPTDTSNGASPQKDDDQLGGNARQLNYALDKNGNVIKSKFVGGTYAPFYLLNKYTIVVKDNTKMQRDTSIESDGRLYPYDTEGSSGCGVVGIVTTVDSKLSTEGSVLNAHGNSATYERGADGCGDGWRATVAYAKYSDVPGVTDTSYKYMEVVTYPCREGKMSADYLSCVNKDYDPAKWRLFSGLVLASDKKLSVGDSIDYKEPVRRLLDRKAYQVRFFINCKATWSAEYGCDATSYPKGYKQLLADTTYSGLKATILKLKQY